MVFNYLLQVLIKKSNYLDRVDSSEILNEIETKNIKRDLKTF